MSDLGVRIVTERQAHVHVSGHPGRPELTQMYDGSGPKSSSRSTARCGTWPSRRASRLSHGVPKAVVQKNGDVIRLAPGEPQKIGEVRVGRLVLDGDVILPADGATMNERRKIGQRPDHGRAADRRGREARWDAA